MFSKLTVADPSKQTKLSENGYSDASNSHKDTVTQRPRNNETIQIYLNY